MSHASARFFLSHFPGVVAVGWRDGRGSLVYSEEDDGDGLRRRREAAVLIGLRDRPQGRSCGGEGRIDGVPPPREMPCHAGAGHLIGQEGEARLSSLPSCAYDAARKAAITNHCCLWELHQPSLPRKRYDCKACSRRIRCS